MWKQQLAIGWLISACEGLMKEFGLPRSKVGITSCTHFPQLWSSTKPIETKAVSCKRNKLFTGQSLKCTSHLFQQ